MNLKKISELFCTSFGIGYSKIFPGTLASLVILPVVWFLKKKFGINIFVIIIVIFSILSFYLIRILIENEKNKDPRFIIVDEYIGQSISLIFCNEEISEYIISFLLFRFFDILKPFPIKYLNNIKNAAGVLLDDVLAGFIVCIFFIVF